VSKTSISVEKEIREKFEWLRENGMVVFALDIAQDVEAEMLKRIHIGKYHKTSHSARKDGDWSDLMEELERVAAIVHRLPKRWQEVAIDRFMDMVVKGKAE